MHLISQDPPSETVNMMRGIPVYSMWRSAAITHEAACDPPLLKVFGCVVSHLVLHLKVTGSRQLSQNCMNRNARFHAELRRCVERARSGADVCYVTADGAKQNRSAYVPLNA